ncbi:hypothetical protein CM318V1_690002 [Carnobacterium maltaromaticum]|uniref:hypothetical protein n=1 Tax=Carnobacterium maltaromaticum TaxID=2751 RepID=UPI00026C830B|nr:hypothetical protein [Carnobacterium maltaromaticum]CRH20322.1 hypothetical protein CM318V1_690002 [Carnobacterium maltaromaticum]
MTGKEALELLVKNMEIKNVNLESVIDSTQKSLERAATDSSERGKILQESTLELCLANIKYCRTQQCVYLEVKQWCEQALKEVEG